MEGGGGALLYNGGRCAGMQRGRRGDTRGGGGGAPGHNPGARWARTRLCGATHAPQVGPGTAPPGPGSGTKGAGPPTCFWGVLTDRRPRREGVYGGGGGGGLRTTPQPHRRVRPLDGPRPTRRAGAVATGLWLRAGGPNSDKCPDGSHSQAGPDFGTGALCARSRAGPQEGCRLPAGPRRRRGGASSATPRGQGRGRGATAASAPPGVAVAEVRVDRAVLVLKDGEGAWEGDARR